MDGYFIAVVVNNAPSKEDQKERPGVWVQVRPVWGPNVKNLIWARVLQPIASKTAGVICSPEVDDEVVVLGGTSDGMEPIVIGGVYTEARKPPTLQGKKDEVIPTVRGLVTPGGLDITIDDTKDKEVILVRVRGDAEGTKDKDLVSLQFAKKDSELTVVAGKATMTVMKGALAIEVKEGDVTIKTGKGNVTLDVKGDAAVKAGGNVNVEGKEINIKCQTAVNIG